MRALTVLSSIFVPGSGQWCAGHPRRALAWIGALLLSMIGMLWLGLIPFLVVWAAQVVDAGFVEVEAHGAIYQLGAIAACVALLLAGALVLRKTVVEAFRIPSGSMIPTLEIGDHTVVSKWSYTPRRGDVIVFVSPKEPHFDYVKRVVAVGGDTIAMQNDQLVLDGKPVPRAHVDAPCEYDDFDDQSGHWAKHACEAWDETLDGRTFRVIQDRGAPPQSWPPTTIPAGEVYVLGDNRDNANDSRYWGGVPAENVKGRARIIWMSSDKDGIRWRRLNRRVR